MAQAACSLDCRLAKSFRTQSLTYSESRRSSLAACFSISFRSDGVARKKVGLDLFSLAM
jgi:hypothetical protein